MPLLLSGRARGGNLIHLQNNSHRAYGAARSAIDARLEACYNVEPTAMLGSYYPVSPSAYVYIARWRACVNGDGH